MYKTDNNNLFRSAQPESLQILNIDYSTLEFSQVVVSEKQKNTALYLPILNTEVALVKNYLVLKKPFASRNINLAGLGMGGIER